MGDHLQKIVNGSTVGEKANPQGLSTEDDQTILNSTVIVHVACDDPRYEDRGLGTVIGDHTIITAKHVAGLAIGRTEIPGLRINDVQVTGEVKIIYTYFGDQGENSGTDVIRMDLPVSYTGSLPPAARIASQEVIDAIHAGDWVSIVYYDHTKDQKTVGKFRVLAIVDGMAKLDDPSKFIVPGDSGGGVYYNGMLIGTTTSIINAVQIDGSANGQKQYQGQFWVTFINDNFR